MAIGVGSRLGPYVLEEKIGSGGMGLIYRAHDTRLDRTVAIKLISDTYLDAAIGGESSGGSRERFLREARAASALNNPNICTIHDIGEQDGHPYLVMELLDGLTLKQVLMRGPLSAHEVACFALEAANALAAAHAKGIIHRDIKPANLFIVHAGTHQAYLKILDFGLAKRNSDVSLTDSRAETVATGNAGALELTSPGSTVGTAAYMSPEQARGETLDARTDLFSLGTVVYEMGTGKSPFGGSSAAEVFAALLTYDPPPLSSANPAMPKGLDKIVARLLEKETVSRYQSAEALKRDLESVVRDCSPTARAEVKEFPAKPNYATRRARGYLYMVVLAIVLAAAGGWMWWRHAHPAEKTVAGALSEKDTVILADFDNQTGDPVFDNTLRTALEIQLEQSPFLNIVSRQQLLEGLAYLGKPANTKIDVAVAREIAEREGVKAVLAGTISSLGSTYIIAVTATSSANGDEIAHEQVEAKGKDNVLPALSTAATKMRAKLGESLSSIRQLDKPLDEATTPSLEAFRDFALGEVEHEHENDIPAAVNYYKQAIALDPNFAMAYARLGVIYINAGSLAKGAEYSKKAFALADTVSERERLYIQSRYYSDVEGDIDKAISATMLLAKTYPREVIATNNLAVQYLLIGQYAQALEWAQKATQLDPNRTATYVNWMCALAGLGHPGDAVKVWQDAEPHLKGLSLDLLQTYMLVEFLNGNTAILQSALKQGQGRSDAYELYPTAAWMTESQGKMQQADTYWEQGELLVEEQKLPDVQAEIVSYRGYEHAMVGQCTDVKAEEARAMALPPNKVVLFNAAAAMALCHDVNGAEKIVAQLGRDYPADTIVQQVFLPSIAGLTALEKKQPQAALDGLAGHEAYDLVSLAPYERGLAELQLNHPLQAVANFQIVLSNRDAFLASGTITQQASLTLCVALSELGEARAYAAAGDKAAAKKAYENFLNDWKDADPGLQQVGEARRDAATL
jgi:eukaryotic-like serine/threonine-protein kinase